MPGWTVWPCQTSYWTNVLKSWQALKWPAKMDPQSAHLSGIQRRSDCSMGESTQTVTLCRPSLFVELIVKKVHFLAVGYEYLTIRHSPFNFFFLPVFWGVFISSWLLFFCDCSCLLRPHPIFWQPICIGLNVTQITGTTTAIFCRSGFLPITLS